MECNLLSHSFAQLAKGTDKAGFLVGKDVEAELAMICSHPAAANTSKRQLFHFGIERGMLLRKDPFMCNES